MVGGSNPRPPHCERGALPAELTAHTFRSDTNYYRCLPALSIQTIQDIEIGTGVNEMARINRAMMPTTTLSRPSASSSKTVGGW